MLFWSRSLLILSIVLSGNIFPWLLRLDVWKAYDSLEWDSIYDTLNFFNFPLKLSQLIMCSIATSHSVGSFKETFSGLLFTPLGALAKDPFSLYIFTLCMECLSCLFQSEVQQKMWVLSTLRKFSISHDFYANYGILFGKATFDNVHKMMTILTKFR